MEWEGLRKRRRSHTDMSRDTTRHLLLHSFACKGHSFRLHFFPILSWYFPKDLRTENIDLLQCKNESFNARFFAMDFSQASSNARRRWVSCILNHLLYSSSLFIRTLCHKRIQFVVLLNLFFSLAFFRVLQLSLKPDILKSNWFVSCKTSTCFRPSSRKLIWYPKNFIL